MKTKYFILASAAVLCAACSNDDALTEEAQPAAADAQVPVLFSGEYLNRTTTRAGHEGAIDLPALKASDAGFGVFGYYTDGEGYSQVSKPNFMYNEKVTHDGTNWTYAPIKYWPNEFGTDAASDDVDRLTFFAYAPYVEVTPSSGAVTGNGTHGITGLTRNSFNGDPLVKYAVTSYDPAKVVDLCWGVYKGDAAFTSSAQGISNNNVESGSPYINLAKPALNEKIKFTFFHALAQLNVQIDAKVDADALTNPVADNTRIWVRSISFEGFTTKGALNLNSNTTEGPTWVNVDGVSKLPIETITIYDGRRDGKEAISLASNETPKGLNDNLIQQTEYTIASGAITTPAATAGVTKDAQNVFNSTDVEAPIYVIPTGEDLKVTIEYDVETYDEKLAGTLADGKTTGSVVSNTITKEIKTAANATIQMFGGKKYQIKLHLGMNKVDFDAAIEDWPTDYEAEGSADLPKNQ